MKNKIIYPSLFILLLWGYGLSAQTDINYSQLVYNLGLVNPSWQGRDTDLTAGLIYGKQWNNIQDAPRTGSFNLHGGLKRYKVTAGLVGHFEKYVVSSKSLVAVQLSSGVQIAPESYLTFGLRLGIDMLAYDKGKIIGAEGDQFYGQSKRWFATGAGLSFIRKGLAIGFSALFDVGNTTAIYAHAEYDILLGAGWNFKPLIFYKYHSDWEDYLEFGVQGGWPEWFQAGITYRTNRSVIFTGALQLFGYASLQYSYHTHTHHVQNLAQSSHEIGLRFNISRMLARK